MDADVEDGEQDLDVDRQPVQDFGEEPKRTWRCIDRVMAIYPPSDDLEQAELEAEVSKAAVSSVARLGLLADPIQAHQS